MSRKQIRIGDPFIYKRILKLLEQSNLKTSKVDEEMDRYLGKTANDSRWLLIKRKYSLCSSNLKRRSSDLEMDPQLFMKVQVRQKQKMKNSSMGKATRISCKRQTQEAFVPNQQNKKFFTAHKRSLDYLQRSSPLYRKLKTQSMQLRKKQNSESWSSQKQKKKPAFRKSRLAKQFQHPAICLYKSTMQNVIESHKSNVQFKKPFDWFANPFELDDF